MKTTLTSLAPELIEEICARLAERYTSTRRDIKTDLANLRLVCQQTRTPPSLYLFHDITLNGRKKRALSFLSSESEIQKYISANDYVFRCARVLRIEFGATTTVRIRIPGMSNAFLVPILRAFRSVRSVEWTVEASDPCPEILDSLASLEGLTTLLLRFNRVPFHDFSMLKLPRLERLSVTDTIDERFAGVLLEQISQLMNEHGCLTQVAIDTKRQYRGPERARHIRFTFPIPKTVQSDPDTMVVEEVVDPDVGADPSAETKPQPIQTTSCPLQYLRLRRCGFLFKSRPQLSTLTTLDVHHMEWGTNKTIWTSLLHVGDVRLKTIIVDSVSPFLFQYLSSYSGLEKLVIADLAPEDLDMAVPVANPPPPSNWSTQPRDTVYGKILPLHQDTLRSLSLGNLAPLDWSPHPRIGVAYSTEVEALLKCSKLTSLSVDVTCLGPESAGKLPGITHNLLTALLRLPSLEFVTINLVALGNIDKALLHWGAERTIGDYPIPREDVFRISTGTRKNFFVPKWKGGEKRRWESTPFEPEGDTALQLGWVL